MLPVDSHFVSCNEAEDLRACTSPLEQVQHVERNRDLRSVFLPVTGRIEDPHPVMILVQGFPLHTVDLHADGADCLVEGVSASQRLLESLIVRSSRNLPVHAGRQECLGEETSNRSHVDALVQRAFIDLRVLAEELFVIGQVHCRLRCLKALSRRKRRSGEHARRSTRETAVAAGRTVPRWRIRLSCPCSRHRPA